LPGGGRLIKTHEPYRRQYPRAIYLVRDVRDVAVSYFHYLQGRGVTVGDFDDFIISFSRGRLDGYGTWQGHVQSWLSGSSSTGSVLIVRYEDLRVDTSAELSKIARFVGIEVTGSDLETAVEDNSPAETNARAREAREFFEKEYQWQSEPMTIREGSRIGEWRSVLEKSHLDALAAAMPVLRELGYPAA
jgi:hypothetical protein